MIGPTNPLRPNHHEETMIGHKNRNGQELRNSWPSWKFGAGGSKPPGNLCVPFHLDP